MTDGQPRVADNCTNLASNASCAIATATDGIGFIVEGTADGVTHDDLLDQVAAADRAKYQWPSRSPMGPAGPSS